MRAAREFVLALRENDRLNQVRHVQAELFGSLGATGKGHGSDKAVLLGLCGETPEEVDPQSVPDKLAAIREFRKLRLLGRREIKFIEAEHLLMYRRRSLPYHPNGMRFTARDGQGVEIDTRVYYSVGGGFVVDDNTAKGDNPIKEDDTVIPYPFTSGAELLGLCAQHDLSLGDIMLENEKCWRDESEIRSGLLNIWDVMQECVRNGCDNDGVLPGGLKVKRRAPELNRKLNAQPEATHRDSLTVMDWVNLHALAVNEENAAGGRVVTAPTNGAAGIIPAVMHYYAGFVPGANDEGIVKFLLTAAAIGVLYKENASISGAEVGCQVEVGSACSMAAGALTEVTGGTPEQVENAAEIGMEHNLGLTCDPIGGLVQVPCIERNAMAAVKAINAARMALRGDGKHFVSLDKVIKTMRDTGRDMKTKYKETARGGLAINVLEVPVNVIEC
jgi:L-serine dehydratase